MSHHSSIQLKQDHSRISAQSKSCKTANGQKNFSKISKIDPDMFDEIHDPEEREKLFYETIERMKKSIEDIHLREAMNAKQIQKLKGDNTDLREKIETLDIELKSTEKAKELDTNYLLQQEETLARSKYKPKTGEDSDDPRVKKEIKRIEESNRKLKAELKDLMTKFVVKGEDGPIEALQNEIKGVLE